MVCIYKPDDEQKNAIKEYTDILGSEEAAYYVLSQNNGFPLDKTPTGEDSDLFKQIENKENRRSAIIKKASLYSSTFLNKYGDWTTSSSLVSDPNILDAKGEPSEDFVYHQISDDLLDIMNNTFLLDDKVNPATGTIDTKIEELSKISPINLDNCTYSINQMLKLSYANYVKTQMDAYTKLNQSATIEEQNQERRNITRRWYDHKVRSIMDEQTKALCAAFGLKWVQRPNGSIELTNTDENNNFGLRNIRIKFVQNLYNDPLEDSLQELANTKLRDKYSEKIQNTKNYIADGVVHYISDSVASRRKSDRLLSASTLILISLNSGSAVTASKTLAYHYITTMFHTDLIQKSLQLFDDNGKRSTLYLVNKLVDAITDPIIGTNKKTSLIDRMYSNTISKDDFSDIEFFNEFWTQFDELHDQVINKGVNSKNARNKILSVVAAAVQLNYQYLPLTMNHLIYDKQNIADDEMLWYSTKYKPDILQTAENVDEMSKYFSTLKKSYENKIERARKNINIESNKKNIATLLLNLQNMTARDMLDTISQQDTLEELFNMAIAEIKEAKDSLQQLNIEKLSSEESAIFIINAYNETISFYNSLIRDMLNPFFQQGSSRFNSLTQMRSDIINELEILEQLYGMKLLESTTDYVEKYIDEYAAQNGDLTSEDILVMKENFRRWLVNQSIKGDVAVYEPWITMNTLSASGIVRIATDIIKRSNARKRARYNVKADKIMKALKKCERGMIKKGKGLYVAGTFVPTINFQTIFQEHDDQGIPTGLFTRKYNYGQYYKLRNRALAQIVNDIQEDIRSKTGNHHFEFDLDKNGHPVFPHEEIYEKYWKRFHIELNRFDCEYANKQFVGEYYELRYKTLSRAAIEAQNDIQERINTIIKPVTKDGIPRVEKLSFEDLKALYYLMREMNALSNTYYEDTGYKKQGEALKIAQELKEFRNLTKQKIVYRKKQTVDKNGNVVDLFEYTTQQIADANERNIFSNYMSNLDINPLWWQAYNYAKERYQKQFEGMPRAEQLLKELDELFKDLNDIINLVKDRGYSEQYLVKLNDLENADALWARAKEIDEEVAKRYQELERIKSGMKLKYNSPGREMCSFQEVYMPNDRKKSQFVFLWEQMYNDLISQGVSDRDARIAADKKYKREVTYIDKYGHPATKTVPLSIFNMMKPKGIPSELANELNIPPGIKFIINQPNPAFQEPVESTNKIYKNGSFVNDDYDREEDSFIQPKLRNNQWDIIQKNAPLKELYDLLINEMAEANQSIPFSFTQGPYKLPQQRGRNMWGLLGRISSMNLPKEILDNLKYVLRTEFTVTENDTDINDDFTTMPDGTRLNSVPLRYIQPLDDPKYMTRDVIGSVLDYIEMAINYEESRKIEPLLIQLLQQVGQNQTVATDRDQPKSIQGKQTNQYNKLKNVIDSQLYKQDYIFGNRTDKKLSQGEKVGIKLAKKIRRVGISSALSRNLFSQTTGFLDALTETFVYSNSEEAFGKMDLAFASAVLGGNAHVAAYNVGKNLASGKIPELMRIFGISGGIGNPVKDTHHSHLRKGAGVAGGGMVVFRLADYTINALTMIAMLHNMRYDEESGTFLSKRDFIGRYTKRDKTKKTGKIAYSKAPTLWESISVKDGRIVFSDDIKNKMSAHEINKLLEGVTTSLTEWVPKFNGAVSEEDKAMIQQNIYTSYVTALRTYLINKTQTFFVTGEDLIDENHSKQKIDAIENKIKGLKEARSRIKSQKNIDKRVAKIEKQILAIEDDVADIYSGKNISKWKVLKDQLKPTLAVGATMFGSTAVATSAANLMSPLLAIISGTIGTAASMLSTYHTYKRSKNYTNSRFTVQLEELERLAYKRIKLQQELEALNNGADTEYLDSEISSLTDQLHELKQERSQKKGIFDFARHMMFHGHMRGFFNAWNNLYRYLSWYTKCVFRPNYRKMKFVPSLKLSPQQKSGFKRICISLCVIANLWWAASYFLAGSREGNFENFYPAKLPVVGDMNKKIAENALKFEDAALNKIVPAVVETKAWNDLWQDVYEQSTEGTLSQLPWVSHYVQAVSDDMLGYKTTIKRSTGEQKRTYVGRAENRIKGIKSVLALQSVRWFIEQYSPYDWQTVNDLLTSASAPLNVNFKTTDAAIQLTQASMEGSTNEYMEGGSWLGYFTRGEYCAANLLAPTGLPAAWKSYKNAGRQAALDFRLNLGLNKLLFPKSKKQQKVGGGKKSKGKGSGRTDSRKRRSRRR